MRKGERGGRKWEAGSTKAPEGGGEGVIVAETDGPQCPAAR